MGRGLDRFKDWICSCSMGRFAVSMFLLTTSACGCMCIVLMVCGVFRVVMF